MKRSSRSAPILFAVVAAVLLPTAARSDTISSTDSFLPAVHVIGATGVYRTDVTIFNPDPLVAAAVDVLYGEADRDGTTRPVYHASGGPRTARVGHAAGHRALDVRPRLELRPSRGQELLGDAGSRHEQHVQRRRRRARHLRPVLARAAPPELGRVRQLARGRSLRHGNPERREPPDERGRHEPDRDSRSRPACACGTPPDLPTRSSS